MYMNLVRGFLEQGNLDMAYQLRDDFTTCSIRNKIAVLDSVFLSEQQGWLHSKWYCW
ncbi:BnaC01g35740D [Brassica napus]|uniref:BnaC01g35740D protein n=1 Tax=Brassica napus TaxID=3708 RepID=A0A078G916_BRANA|nr:BnaC01g35740D [Brassica napus]